MYLWSEIETWRKTKETRTAWGQSNGKASILKCHSIRHALHSHQCERQQKLILAELHQQVLSFLHCPKLLFFSKRALFSLFILRSSAFFGFVSFGLMLSAARKPLRSNNGRRKNWCVFICVVTEKEIKGALRSRVCCLNGCCSVSQTKRLIRLIMESITSGANCTFPQED